MKEEKRVGHKAYNLSLLKNVKGKSQIQGYPLVLKLIEVLLHLE